MRMNKYTILLADDDEDDRLFFREGMKAAGIGTDLLTEVANGAEVLSFLEASEVMPDLIILDQNMPLMTGEETLEHIKSHRKYHHIPVAIYSTSDFQNGYAQFMSKGALSVSVKPLNMAGYKALVTSMLSQISQ